MVTALLSGLGFRGQCESSVGFIKGSGAPGFHGFGFAPGLSGFRVCGATRVVRVWVFGIEADFGTKDAGLKGVA